MKSSRPADQPRRGEIWLVNFNPARGSEQKGIRPALVIQNDVGNVYGSTTIIAAMTATIKEFPVTVVLPGKSAGLEKQSMVNTAQLITVDKARLIKKLGVLGQVRLSQVDEALRVSMGLEGT